MPVGAIFDKTNITMKKLLLSAVALLVASLSFGQAKWGIIAGPNFSSVTAKQSTGSKETTKILTGIRAGVTVDIPLSDEFYIGTGLLYAGKGGKFKDAGDMKITLGYLQLPVNFMFKPEVGNGWIVLAAGPYVAYGLGGKYKDTPPEFSPEDDVDAFGDEAGLGKLKRFDAGANVNIGYEMRSGLFFGLNTDLGLVNIYDNTSGGRRFKNTSFGVSVGYKFGAR